MRRPYCIWIQASLATLVMLLGSGCETFDPIEETPSFIEIDEVDFVTTGSQGGAAHRIEDVWVLNGEEVIGVFPLPAQIPFLVEGPTEINIRAGIRINGVSSARAIYQYYSPYTETVDLVRDSTIQIRPEFRFSQFADFALVEDFEGSGLDLTVTSGISESEILRTSDPEIAFSGQSGHFKLQPAQHKFECKSAKFNLPGSGNVVILEFNYKGNNPLVVGAYVYNPGQTIQLPIVTLNPSDEWKRLYVNLTEAVSGNPNNQGVEVFFGMIRDDSLDGDSDIYIDNIKLVY